MPLKTIQLFIPAISYYPNPSSVMHLNPEERQKRHLFFLHDIDARKILTGYSGVRTFEIVYLKCQLTIENDGSIFYSLLNNTVYSKPQEGYEINAAYAESAFNLSNAFCLNGVFQQCIQIFKGCPVFELFSLDQGIEYRKRVAGILQIILLNPFIEQYYLLAMKLFIEIQPTEPEVLQALFNVFEPSLNVIINLNTISQMKDFHQRFHHNQTNPRFRFITYNTLWQHLHSTPISNFTFVATMIDYYGSTLSIDQVNILRHGLLFRLSLQINSLLQTLIVAESEEDKSKNTVVLRSLSYLLDCLDSISKKWGVQTFPLKKNLANTIILLHEIQYGFMSDSAEPPDNDREIIDIFLRFSCLNIPHDFLADAVNDTHYPIEQLNNIKKTIQDFCDTYCYEGIESYFIISQSTRLAQDAATFLEETNTFLFPLNIASYGEQIHFILSNNSLTSMMTRFPFCVDYLRKNKVTSLVNPDPNYFIAKLVKKFFLTPETLTDEEKYFFELIQTNKVCLIISESVLHSLLITTDYLRGFTFTDESELALLRLIDPELYGMLFKEIKSDFSNLAQDESAFITFLNKYCRSLLVDEGQNPHAYQFYSKIMTAVSNALYHLPVNNIHSYLRKVLNALLPDPMLRFESSLRFSLSLVARLDYQQIYNFYLHENITTRTLEARQEYADRKIQDILRVFFLMHASPMDLQKLKNFSSILFTNTDFKFAIEKLFPLTRNFSDFGPNDTLCVIPITNFIQKGEYELSSIALPQQVTFFDDLYLAHLYPNCNYNCSDDFIFSEKTDFFFKVVLKLLDRTNTENKQCLIRTIKSSRLAEKDTPERVEAYLKILGVRSQSALAQLLTNKPSAFPKVFTAKEHRFDFSDKFIFQLLCLLPPTNPVHINIMTNYLQRPHLLLTPHYQAAFVRLFEAPLHQLHYSDIENIFSQFILPRRHDENIWLSLLPANILRKIEKIILRHALHQWLSPHNSILQDILGVLDDTLNLQDNFTKLNPYISLQDLPNFILNIYFALQPEKDPSLKIQEAEEVTDDMDQEYVSEPLPNQSGASVNDSEIDHTWYSYNGIDAPGIYPAIQFYVEQYNAELEDIHQAAHVTQLPLVVDIANCQEKKGLTKALMTQMLNTIQEVKQISPYTSRIFYPISLYVNHWCLLVIDLNNHGKINSLSYFDPRAEPLEKSPELNMALNLLLQRLAVNREIRVHAYNQPLQSECNSWDCGPWVVEAARHLLTHDSIPDASHDIELARIEHRNLDNVGLNEHGKRPRLPASSAAASANQEPPFKRQGRFFSSSVLNINDLFTADKLESWVYFLGKTYFNGIKFKLRALLDGLVDADVIKVNTKDGKVELRLKIVLNQVDKDGNKNAKRNGEIYTQMVENNETQTVELRITPSHLFSMRFHNSNQKGNRAPNPYNALLSSFTNSFALFSTLFDKVENEINHINLTPEEKNHLFSQDQQDIKNLIIKALEPYTSLRRKEHIAGQGRIVEDTDMELDSIMKASL